MSFQQIRGDVSSAQVFAQSDKERINHLTAAVSGLLKIVEQHEKVIRELQSRR